MIGMLIGAWMDVRSQPFRTTAAIAGLVAAVVAVILVDAAAVLSTDANEIYLARKYGMPVTISIMSQSGDSDSTVPMDDILRGNDFIYTSIDTQVSATIVKDGQIVTNGFRWVNSAYADIRIVDMVAGAWPRDTTNSDVLHVVVTSGWGNLMFALSDEEMVGMHLQYAFVRDAPFDVQNTPPQSMVIDGVVDASTAAFQMDGPITVVSDLAVPPFVDEVMHPSWLVRVDEADVGFLMASVALAVDENGLPVYMVQRADQGDTLAPVLRQQRVTGTATKAIALTVGGLGILGVGVSGVRERASEFGLRRAIGAKRRRIFGGVLVQTLMEAIIAALIAIPLAALLLEYFARDLVLSTLPMPPSTMLPLQSAMLGLLGAVLVGIIAGLVPAIHAARTSVIRALRG
ncbi:MAG: ABC transporter permease [Thermomicrobiales bacterium]|nr:ABC transporter permease [Thermomicrobiales bacterium]MCO5224083.1 ABC transporter permease [Thermomicrobiales bacterium]MCO5226918.1 ABC transporter permease [Thermomicrobiales bacterium]